MLGGQDRSSFPSRLIPQPMSCKDGEGWDGVSLAASTLRSRKRVFLPMLTWPRSFRLADEGHILTITNERRIVRHDRGRGGVGAAE